MNDHPYLFRDEGCTAFLRRYAGASMEYGTPSSPGNYMTCIYSYYDLSNFARDLDRHPFCETAYWPTSEQHIIHGFFFGLDGSQKLPVFREVWRCENKVTELPEMVCDRFVDWLQVVLECNGRFE